MGYKYKIVLDIIHFRNRKKKQRETTELIYLTATKVEYNFLGHGLSRLVLFSATLQPQHQKLLCFRMIYHQLNQRMVSYDDDMMGKQS